MTAFPYNKDYLYLELLIQSLKQFFPRMQVCKSSAAFLYFHSINISIYKIAAWPFYNFESPPEK